MGTAAAPARWAATYPTPNSTASAVAIRSPTRSPRSTPAATRPRATALACWSHSEKVISSPSTTRTAGRSPKRSARTASSSGISTWGLSSGGMAAAPLLLGVLYDFPQADEGAGFEEAVRQGIAEVSLDRDVELVPRQAAGLPAGSAHDVRQKFDELVDAGVLAVIGPSISDNGLLVRDWADAAEVPCVNYTGGERTRSDFMFHYQVGSLAEEPIVLAEHLAARNLRSAAMIHDRSPVGKGYAE